MTEEKKNYNTENHEQSASKTLDSKQDSNDPFLWLEEIDSASSMKWVKEQNSLTVDHFNQFKETKEFADIQLEISSRQDQVRNGNIHNGMVYDLWQDQKNPRGLWQRQTLENYLAGANHWETIIDFDALGKKEGKSWVFKGAVFLDDKLGEQLALVSLSPGGQDATVIREFSLDQKNFLQDGFLIPESKSNASYFDRNTIIVNDATTTEVKTDIGYPMVAKVLKRGGNLRDAQTMITGEKSHVSTGAYTSEYNDKVAVFAYKSLDFYTSESFWINMEDLSSHKLPIPTTSKITATYKNFLIIQNQHEWKLPEFTLSPGSLVALNLTKFIADNSEEYILVKQSTKDFIIKSVTATKDYLYITGQNNVIGEVSVMTFENDQFISEHLPLPANGNAYVFDNDFESNTIQIGFESFLNPTTTYIVSHKNNLQKIHSARTDWDSSAYETIQYWATSKDGVKIPYFVLKNKNTEYDGKNPTLLYGYGGFKISLNPYYSESRGRLWLDQGGIYVLANIRGGGEFGPEWHQAALLFNKQKSYDDFISVAEDLIFKKITSPKHLGIMGGSNGGLLVGAVMVQRPDLFYAVICSVPLLDMMRYTLMPNAKGDRVGQSWAAEYGDPIADPKIADYISKYSPYQNVVAEKKYPHILFTTSTKDDRVVPSHARKMAAKMMSMQHNIWYYENVEGGHGGSADLKQQAQISGLQYSYLKQQLF